MGSSKKWINQYHKPTGLKGRIIAKGMNLAHKRLTIWGLDKIDYTDVKMILDIGCGGGKTIKRHLSRAPYSKVYGIDLSEECVKISIKENRKNIGYKKVQIDYGDVANLPYQESIFDLITAIETVYFWSDIEKNLSEVRRVLKKDGKLIIIGECYRGNPKFEKRNQKWVNELNMHYFSLEEYKNILLKVGFSDVEIFEEINNGWFMVKALK